MDIILASGSPYRRRLLKRLNIPFTCLSPDIDENPRSGENPTALAKRLSREKAEAIARNNPHSCIIASDQVAVLGDTLLSKPGTEQNAAHQLRQASGKSVSFLTGLCLLTPDHEPVIEVIPYSVRFRVLNDGEIERYIKADQPLDCAGSFKWEQLGISLFASMEGEDPTALEGLPLIRLSSLLRQRGRLVP